MNEQKSAAFDTLLILAPPARLVIWLEKVFEAKRKKGEVVPEQFDHWLDRWAKIRSHLPSEVDVLTPAEWQEIHNKVGGSAVRQTQHPGQAGATGTAER